MPGLQITDYRLQIRSVAIKIFLFAVLYSLFSVNGYAQEKKEEPIIVNGDTVEYSTDAKEVTATGNVSVIYKGSKLTCHKLTVNTQTKEAEAEGNARLDDKKGVIEGEKIKYNFQTKTGTIIDSKFRANPYFGKAEKTEKVSDTEFMTKRGYFTTCNYDNPHYRIKSRRINVFPGDKIQTKDDIFYLGRAPLFYLPQYNHSLKDPIMHVQLMPGKRKDWGPYMLSAWRYNLTENVSGRIYFDYRNKLGTAEGFGTNYTTQQFGKGDFKYYYTQERSRFFEEGVPAEFQRYLIRWRHKWVIDKQTDFTSEYYKIVDSKMAIHGSTYNFLKDYFFREYEKDSQPLSYTLLHHSFNYSSLDFLMQKRTNRWYSPGYLEKLPEIKYSLPSLQIVESPFYFGNDSSLGNFNKKNTSTMTPTANDTNPDVHVNRFDTSNKLSLPMKVTFVQFTPYVMNRETFYDKRAVSSTIAPRTVFYSGADMSTKFYRLFNVRSNFLKLDINGLRHTITPTVAYSFNHEPSILSSKLRQIDGVDSLSRSNYASLGLSNKLQTKRNNQSVDLLDLNVSSSYIFKPKGDSITKSGSSLSDFLFQLKLLPYSWMSINSDATYVHSGARDSANYNHFSNANYDLNFSLGEERSFGVGQRYQLKGGNEITYNLKWRLSPKWKFSAYQRYYRGHETTRARGLREQEYSISRDLHCWTWDITYNIKRGYGDSIWFVFTLKAFPELQFDFNQDYRQPKPGSQSGVVQ